MVMTEFVQLWKKLYILVQVPLQKNLRARLQCIKAVQLSSLVVQLFKNIDIGTTEFV